jgi:hypothetical protein
MAFGKKKDGEPEAAAQAPAEDDDAPLFPDEEPAAELAPASETPPTADAAPTAEATAAPVPAEPAMPSTDSLLSAFQTTEGGEEDRSVLLDLAGEVELADLLEELNTLAAAIGVVRA